MSQALLQDKLSVLADCLNGQLTGADAYIQSVSTDTRTLLPGDLFVALVGDRFNGHDYIAVAEEKGAAAILACQAVDTTLPQLQVADTTLALGQLGNLVRQRADIPVFAITGSCGKTSTKAILYAILSKQASTLMSPASFNNAIGLPLTLLALNSEHRYCIVELGTNAPGEIAMLTAIAEPTVAVVLNAGPTHLEKLLTVDGVAEEKAAIYQQLGQEETAVINLDSPYATHWQKCATGAGRQLTYGQAESAMVRACDVHLDERGRARFTCCIRKGDSEQEFAVQLPLYGEHHVSNALAAVSLALAVQVPIVTIADGLADVSPVVKRMNKQTGINGAIIIDDSYNANPTSVKAAIEFLAVQAQTTKILVLGAMNELGADAQEYHSLVGEQARHAGINYLLGLGELTQFSVRAFGEGGDYFTDRLALQTLVQTLATLDTVILVKGSNSMRMWEITETLANEENTPCSYG